MKSTWLTSLWDNYEIGGYMIGGGKLSFEKNAIIFNRINRQYQEIMRLVIPYYDIDKVWKSKRFIVFPCFIIKLKNNSTYKFVTVFWMDNRIIKQIENEIIKVTAV